MSADEKTIQDGIWDALIECAAEDSRIVVIDADLSRATGSYRFAERYPRRFFNVGIAEQDLVGFGAGLAASGKIPFIASFAAFLTRNAYAQIYLNGGISKLPLKLLGFAAGMSAGLDGVTHMAINDCALMGTVPDLEILEPSTYDDAYGAIMRTLSPGKSDILHYVRISKKTPCDIDHFDTLKFSSPRYWMRGSDITLVGAGPIMERVYKAGLALRNGPVPIYADVINASCLTLKKLNIIWESARKTQKIIVVQDHLREGGLGDAIYRHYYRFLKNDAMISILIMGVNQSSITGGIIDDLWDDHGLSVNHIIKNSLKMVKG